MAISSVAGTQNWRSMRASSAPWRCVSCLARLMRAGIDAGRRVFLKALAERAALAPVAGKHGAIGHETGKRAVEHGPRDADGRGFARHDGQESVKIAAARRGSGVRSEKQGAKQGCREILAACRSSMFVQAINAEEYRDKSGESHGVMARLVHINGSHQGNVSSCVGVAPL